jgi:hypothetical protein
MHGLQLLQVASLILTSIEIPQDYEPSAMDIMVFPSKRVISSAHVALFIQVN